VIRFGSRDLDLQLPNMSQENLDNLSFGAVELDRNGKILRYNKAEGNITGRDPKATLGKNFFREVAPCTNSPEFYGKFEDGVKRGSLNTLFEYTFDHEMRPTKVKVQMKKDPQKETYWIFVKRI
jgi:photoactive yellow protein